MKIKRILAIFILLLTLCLSGFLLTQNKTESVYADTAYNSYYLLDETVGSLDNQPFKSGIIAGQTSGYTSSTKEYQLGDTVNLSTTATNGFKVVGWRVVYEKIESGIPTTITKFLVESGTLEGIDYTISYSGTNFSLSSAFADMIIEPVFDYIHYNLDITSFNEILDLGIEVYIGETYINATDKYNDYFYYKTSNEESGITTYSNVILKRIKTFVVDEGENVETKFYYFNELKTADGTNYYTTKTVNEFSGNSTRELKTDYKLGCYELADQVESNFSVAYDGSDLKTSKNINLKSVSFNSNVLNKTSGELTNNSYFETRNAYNLTTSFGCKATIVDGANALSINRENLYLVGISSFVDGDNIDELTLIAGDKDLIESSYDVVSYQKVDNTNYLAGQSGIKFTAKDVGKLNPETNTISKYYNYEHLEYTLAGPIYSTEFTLSELNNNLDVEVYFESCSYNIGFRFAVRENDVISETSGEVLETITNGRGFTLNKDTEIDELSTFADEINNLSNIGYSFYGVADLDLNDIESIDDFEYVINAEYPVDQTFYLVFEKIEYTVRLTNTTGISLNNSSVSASPTTFYPINSISFAKGDILSNVNGISADSNFTTKVKIGDNIKFSYNATNGFIINGVKFVNGTESNTATSFTIDADFITNYANGEMFTINADVDYARYSLTYITSVDTDSNIVANIDVTDEDNNPIATALKYESAEATVDNPKLSNPYKIVVNNLKLYDVVKLTHSSLDVNYQFVNFKSGNFTLSVANTTYEFIVNRADISTYTINVNYSNITNQLILSSDINSAIDLSDFKVLQGGEEIDIFSESVNKGSEVTIRLPNNKFYLGYNFISYTVKNANISDLVLTTIGDYEETINEVGYKYKEIKFTPNQDGVFEVQLNFEYIEYYYEVYTRIGGGEISVAPVTSGILTVENNGTKTIQFEKTLGYYVSEFSYGLNQENQVSLNKKQSNSDRFEDGENFRYFTYLFEDEMNSLMNLGENLVFVATYSIFTYDIDLDVKLNGGDLGSAVSKQDLKLTYLDQFDNTVGDPIVVNNSTSNKFASIPYGSKVKVEVLDIKKGLKFGSWELNESIYTKDSNINGVGFRTDNYLTISSINKDYSFTLDLTYEIYSISLKYDESENVKDIETGVRLQGKVSNVYVNSQSEDIADTDVTSRFNLFNDLSFKLLPNETNGYTYNGVYLKINKDKNIFSQNKFYEKIDNKFVLTEDLVFDSNKDYYISLPIENFFATIESIDVEKFEIENILNVYVSFEFFKFKVSNNTAQVTKANFGGNDVLEYSVSVKQNVNDTWTLINDEDLIDISYKVRINIKLNQYEGIDVYRGAILNSIQIGSNVVLNNNDNGEKFRFYDVNEDIFDSTKDYQFIYIGNGEYVVYLNMAGTVRNIDNEEFNLISSVNINQKSLNLVFGLLKRDGVSVHVSTSIPSTATDFYSAIQLEMRFGQRSKLNNGSSFVELQSTFLNTISVNYYFQESGYDSNFKLTGVKFKIGNETKTYLTEEDLDNCKNFGMKGLINGNLNQINLFVVDDIEIIFEILPIIRINGAEYTSGTDIKLSKTFECNNVGAGLIQDVDDDVEADNGIKAVMVVNYYLDGNSETPVELKNVGLYHAVLTFDLDGVFGTMLEGVEIEFDVEILPLQIVLQSTASQSFKLAKEYNASDNYSSNALLQYIKITAPNSLLNVNYIGSNFVFNIPTFAKIRENNSDISATSASEQGQYYDLKLYGIAMKDGYEFNKNFTLVNNDLTFAEIVYVTKREISVYNLGADNILDKVYDGTDVAYIKDKSIVTFQKNNVLNNDDIVINTDKIKLTFEKFENPGISRVKVDLTGTIEGASARNYTVKETEYYVEGKIIYPQKLSVNIVDFGTVSIENIDVLNDKTNESLISLIPLNATLIVDTVYSESSDFIELYQNSDLSDYLSNRKVFAVGFNVYVVDFKTGSKVPINNKLYLRLPSVEKLTQVLNIYDNTSSNLYYTVDEDGTVIVKLEQIGDDLHYLVMIEDRPVVQLWQILLISFLGAGAVGTGIGLFIFFRKRKLKLYSSQEKI